MWSVLKIQSKMKLTYKPYNLQLQHTFSVSGYSRNTTPIVLVEIAHENLIGYGEASLPPYLGESQKSVISFMKKVDLSQFKNPLELTDILQYLNAIPTSNKVAIAAIDIALHDLMGKIMQKPLYEIWGINPYNTPYTSYTIGIDKVEIIKNKTLEANQYKILKVKLGSANDKQIINTIRSVTDVPLYIDANQGWKDKFQALEMIQWLAEKGIELIEQPMPKAQLDDMAWLTQHSPLPTIADESFQELGDIEKLKGVYSGINIKLMKSAGLLEALKMIQTANNQNMKVMLGCMTETSCAISAAAHLSPLVDWADLDGNLLITNDPFDGVKINNGKITLNSSFGIGVKKIG